MSGVNGKTNSKRKLVKYINFFERKKKDLIFPN